MIINTLTMRRTRSSAETEYNICTTHKSKLASMAVSRRIHVESRNGRRFSRSTWPSKQKELRMNMKRLRVEMAEISMDQKRIRKDQTEIRGKLEQIREQCAKLREETDQIVKQKARSQLLLALVFKVLKAREAGDFATAVSLTRLIREVIQKQRNK